MPNPFTNLRTPRPDPLAQLFSPLRPTAAEWTALKSLEADPQAHAQRLAALDRKYKVRSPDLLAVDPKLIRAEAFRAIPGGLGTPVKPIMRSNASVLSELFQTKQAHCDCVVPFCFTGLRVYNAMSGPEQREVHLGVIGACRDGPNDYTVWNPGDTQGTTRVALNGQMHSVFECTVPQAGRWCLIHPSGWLFVRGHSRVVGHGNSTTSYDAKVWVDYYQVLEVGQQLLEIAGGQIHYDGTRSEDRTKAFIADVELPPRAVFFQTTRDREPMMLTLRIEVQADANEDGIGTGVIDMFGLPANLTSDCDTFIVKTF